MDIKKQIEAIGINLSNFDYVVWADGSGCQLKNSCAWAGAIYAVDGNLSIHICGGLSNGTNNMAELFPFVQSLDYINRTHVAGFHGVKIACISDSELTVKIGNGLYEPTINLNLWAAINWLKLNCNFKVEWFHINRNSQEAAILFDKNAGVLRKLIQEKTNEIKECYLL